MWAVVNTWLWSLLKRDTWGDGTARAHCSPVPPQGDKKCCVILTWLVLLLCTLQRHLTTAALAYKWWFNSVLMPDLRCTGMCASYFGHCRRFIVWRSLLLNIKGEFCTEIQSSDCALHFGLSMLLTLVTLSFNVDVHLDIRLDLPGKHFQRLHSQFRSAPSHRL